MQEPTARHGGVQCAVRAHIHLSVEVRCVPRHQQAAALLLLPLDSIVLLGYAFDQKYDATHFACGCSLSDTFLRRSTGSCLTVRDFPNGTLRKSCNTPIYPTRHCP